MGQLYKPNLLIPTDVIVAMLRKLDESLGKVSVKEDKFDGMIFGFYIVISYVLSL